MGVCTDHDRSSINADPIVKFSAFINVESSRQGEVRKQPSIGPGERHRSTVTERSRLLADESHRYTTIGAFLSA